ncbi:MAG TPA: chloride channel protein [Candidatus Binatia bacterium]|nr:chloride channel protein [Candidatus Binatia bacterium]
MNPEPLIGPWGLWLIPVATTLGGLLSGILVYTFAPEAEGHGTDAAVEAFHFKGGKVRPVVPLIKVLSSAITIGSGGAAGREGPPLMLGVFDSWHELFGQLCLTKGEIKLDRYNPTGACPGGQGLYLVLGLRECRHVNHCGASRCGSRDGCRLLSLAYRFL